MARGKKKKGLKKAKKKSPGIFNPALSRSDGLRPERRTAPERPRKKAQKDIDAEEEDSRFFVEAMSGVKPISGGKKLVTREPDPNLRPSHGLKDEDMEVMAHLSDLVTGSAELDITFSDEYIEGSVQGFSLKLMQRLKRGRFPIQDHTDLHGLNKREAEVKIRDFLVNSHRRGLRCVLVVHGRGLNSENNIPVLKERLPGWLRKGPAKKIVLAFSTARPYDGGTGAIYILLRRRKGIKF